MCWYPWGTTSVQQTNNLSQHFFFLPFFALQSIQLRAFHMLALTLLKEILLQVCVFVHNMLNTNYKLPVSSLNL
jgi:hypothetical protein